MATIKRLRTALAAGLCLLAFAAPARESREWQALGTAFETFVATQGLPGASLQVEFQGQVVLRRRLGNISTHTFLPIASASKWLSGVALARLVEKGLLRWDSRVGEFFPDAPAATLDITLQQLFSHTSGMQAAEAPCMANPDGNLDACARSILALPLAYAPGQGFAYGGTSMQVAGRMAEIASGLAWDDLFQREVVVPLGLTQIDFGLATGRPVGTRVGNPRIGGGVRTTADDYLVMLRMWRNLGLHQGQRYLQAATIRYMELNRASGLPVLSSPYPASDGYGLGMWRLEASEGGRAHRLGSAGLFGFHPWIDRGADLIGVFAVLDDYSRVAAGQQALQVQAFDIATLRRTQAAPIPIRRDAAPGQTCHAAVPPCHRQRRQQ